MAEPSAIVQDLVRCLRESGLFAEVTAGGCALQTSLPRAELLGESQEFFRPDDSAGGQWIRLRVRLLVRTRCSRQADTRNRPAELMQAAIAAIMADPYRGGLCQDLPVGLASELERVAAAADKAEKKEAVEGEMAAILRFHSEQLPVG